MFSTSAHLNSSIVFINFVSEESEGLKDSRVRPTIMPGRLAFIAIPGSSELVIGSPISRGPLIALISTKALDELTIGYVLLCPTVLIATAGFLIITPVSSPSYDFVLSS